LPDIHCQHADICSEANGLLGMVTQERPYLGLLWISEFELSRESFHMAAHHIAHAHHASAAPHTALRGCFLVILLALSRHAHTLAIHHATTTHHALHPFHHTLHALHHALHLLGLRWCACASLCRC
jgi:hypothetical protein